MLEKLKRCFKSWTINTATAMTILGVVQANLSSINLSQVQQGYTLIGIGVLMALLRAKTDKPLSER